MQLFEKNEIGILVYGGEDHVENVFYVSACYFSIKRMDELVPNRYISTS